MLEALASGLPVLYHDSGAMAEVIGECGLPVTVENFAPQLEQVMDRWTELSLLARQRVLTHFHPQRVFPRYVDAIQAALQRPTTVPVAYRLWLAWSEPVRWRGRRLARALQHGLGQAVTTIGLNWPRQGL